MADRLLITAFGQQATVREWVISEKCRVPARELRRRLRRGWRPEVAICRPLQRKPGRLLPPEGREKHSTHRGVTFDRCRGRWVARIMHDGKRRFLGAFLDEDYAAMVYDNAACRLRGPRARKNFPEFREASYACSDPALPSPDCLHGAQQSSAATQV